jgi:hypothetical protein
MLDFSFCTLRAPPGCSRHVTLPMGLDVLVGMNLRVQAVFAALLGPLADSIGASAEFSPHGFLRSFLRPGHPWVSTLGPDNEHLTRDVGSQYLRLAVPSFFASDVGSPEGFRLLGAAWSPFAPLHLGFRLHLLDVFSAPDADANRVALGGQLPLGLGLLFESRSARREVALS